MRISDINSELAKFDKFVQMFGLSRYGKLRRPRRKKHISIMPTFLKFSNEQLSKISAEAFLKPFVDTPHKWNHRLKALRVFCRDFCKLNVTSG